MVEPSPPEPEPVQQELVQEEPAPVGPQHPSCLHVAITFDVGDDKEEIRYAVKKPLGLGYAHTKGAPVNTVKPGMHAEELGIQLGWKIKALNGNLTAGKTVDQFKKELTDLVGALPE